MTDNSNEVKLQILELLGKSNGLPDVEEWKKLIEENPNSAGLIVDSAILNSIAEEESSDSQIGALFEKTLSSALSKVSDAPSELLHAAEEKVANVKGPAARHVAINVGIGAHVSLLNGILVGRIQAPGRIIASIAEYLDVPIAALSELFQQSFAANPVPAFKSPNGAPKINVKPNTWEEAVGALNLDADETLRLLKLSEEK